MVIRAHQNQVVQFGFPAVFPVPNVMGVQAAGGPAAGHRAGGVAVLQRAAQPAVDQPGGAAGADGVAVVSAIVAADDPEAAARALKETVAAALRR